MTDPRAASADALLLLDKFQRRPDELRHRLRLLALLLPIIGVLGLVAIFFTLSFLPSPFAWPGFEIARYGVACVVGFYGLVFLWTLVRRWLFGTDETVPRTIDRSPPDDETASCSPLSPKVVVVAMIVMGVVLALLSVSIIEGEPQNLASYLGFAAIQLLATFALASAFRAAWNTSSWVTWIAVLLFLSVVMSLFGYLASSHDGTGIMHFVYGLQALAALSYEFSLLFVRPLFVSASGPRTTERFTGRQRVIAAVSVLLIVLSSAALSMRFRLQEQWLRHSVRVTAEKRDLIQRQLDAARRRERNAVALDDMLDKEPTSLSSNAATRSAATKVPKSLLGRWVVVSSEGPPLNSAAMMLESGSSLPGPSAPASPLGLGGSMGGASFGAGMGANSVMPPLQWIEFADNHVVVFDGREAKLVVEFSNAATTEPNRLSLRSPSFQAPDVSTDWRYGIYRLERDRLILCWTNNGQPVPTEFAGDNSNGWGTQLLVLRREWNPPAEYRPRETPPPRATIPFTAREAKLLQSAWADSADVGVEITNSLGMKLRVLPAGAFDAAGAVSFDGFQIQNGGAVGTGFSQPIYIGTTEVTVAQFRKFVEATKYVTTAERAAEEKADRHSWQKPGIVQDSDQHPVVNISWQDAQAFCRWLSDTEQQQYRLPTITEWAFAARAGVAASTPLKLPHNARLRFFDTTAPVGSDKANLFGLHDLFGNVGEWANDAGGGGFFGGSGGGVAGRKDDPDEAKGRSLMVTALGGGYQSSRPRDTRVEWLLSQFESDSGHFVDIGFRVVREIVPEADAAKSP